MEQAIPTTHAEGETDERALKREKNAAADLPALSALAERILPQEGRAEFLLALPAILEQSPREETLGLGAETFLRGLWSFWRFGERRPAGRHRLRFYQPSEERDGWSGPHAVLEAVNDDMPFLMDSLAGLLTDHGLRIHALIHPILWIGRDEEGARMPEADAPSALRESWIQIQCDAVGDAAELAALEAAADQVVREVRAAVLDWKPMTERLAQAVGELRANAPAAAKDAAGEAAAFLEWLRDDHFTFLGWRDYRLSTGPDERRHAVAESGLGLMRDPEFTVLRDPEGAAVDWSPELDAFASDDEPLLVLKANRRSSVHRTTHLDMIVVKRFDADGAVIGEAGIVGLFTSSAYQARPLTIPMLRGKLKRIIARGGFAPASHDGKALVSVLDRHPRDELFQASDDQLFEQAMGALQLDMRPRPRLFVRPDRFGRFYSCIVYAPRDRYDTAQRQEIGEILCEALNGRVASFTPTFDDAALIRIHFVIAALPGPAPTLDVPALEARVAEAVRDWSDALRQALIDRHGEAEGARLHRAYAEGCDADYRQAASPAFAAVDIEKFETLGGGAGVATGFFRLPDDAEAALRFKLYRYGELAPLSDVIPILEDMGLRIIQERPFRIERRGPDGEEVLYLHDFLMRAKRGDLDADTLAARRPALEEGFVAVWRGESSDDPLNRLMLDPGLCPRRTALLRAYSRFLLQARIPYSVSYMEDALAENPGVAEALTRLFAALFDPSDRRDADARLASAQEIQAEIEEALEQVASLDVDRILRRFRNAITATLRTNYYQTDAEGALKPYFSFKFDSSALEDLPAPRPWREIFIYAPWVEGVHLRGGPVARGGLRWSDRREDFRTEVLGLVKAQQVKNSVIVPVGSKGGFLPKRLPVGGEREAIQAEAIRSYKTFLSGLLDLTDNLVDGAPVPPPLVVRRDEDDPYLVVAADKGTATFSDIANGVAEHYGFWLGDAFASGGSQGYDHKGMGITARGAWEAVKRHFRELGHDTQTEPFTVIGVGDMSGDVFGNGMLLSDRIRLLAAFDHRDVFIDPDPDPAASFEERRRLFQLKRSSWRDYDQSRISAGGGVFSRTAKSIALTDEIRALIGSQAARMTPMDLIKALLKAPADLLWFGGIGTYVKDVEESHAEVGDRANDGVRIDAEALGARVVGEGANLGVTQRARIALSHRGVKINTDAVDNAAGVDCSDHEVNIKIALGAAVAAGEIDREARDALLAEMTDEVGRLVLRSNYAQTAAISLAEARAPALLEDHARFMREAESAGRLDRAVEFLPDEAAIAARRKLGEGLTRPEIAVLMAYAKIGLFKDLTDADLMEDPFLEAWLVDYFPSAMRERFRREILGHRLRREIIATALSNAMVNEGGLEMVMRLGYETGATPPEVARAYLSARELFDLGAVAAEIDALDNRVAAETQIAMRLTVQDALAAQCLNLLQRGENETVAETLEMVGPGVREVCAHLADVISDYSRRRMADSEAALIEAGAPEGLAARVAALEFQGGAVTIVDTARRLGRSVAETAATYYAVGGRFELDWLRFAARDLRPSDDWERVAIDRLTSDLRAQQAAIAAAALRASEGVVGAASVAEWAKAYPKIVDRADRIFAELRQAEDLTVSKLAVASSLLSGWG